MKQEQEEETIYRTWDDIAERLGVSEATVRRWWDGRRPDPCGVRDAVQKLGRQIVYASETDLAECFRRLWVEKHPDRRSPALQNPGDTG